MKIAMTEFKAKCTQVVREVATAPHTVEITKHGKVVAIVTAPPAAEAAKDPASFWGSLHGTVLYIATDFDAPMGDGDWEAAR